MDAFFSYDAHSAGTKGLVYIGDTILVWRRGDDTAFHPMQLDVPGGEPEGGETPFETFQRTVNEQFGLKISRDDIEYVRRYESVLNPGMFGYFPVARLPKEQASHITFNDEGPEYILMPLNDYLDSEDAWPLFQQRGEDYAKSIS